MCKMSCQISSGFNIPKITILKLSIVSCTGALNVTLSSISKSPRVSRNVT